VLFNSFSFVFVFLPLAMLGFALCVRWQARHATLAFLTVASLCFYAWWDWCFLALILGSVLTRQDALRVARTAQGFPAARLVADVMAAGAPPAHVEAP